MGWPLHSFGLPPTASDDIAPNVWVRNCDSAISDDDGHHFKPA